MSDTMISLKKALGSIPAGERQPFGPGDLLFAAQGTERLFEKFTPDFWVIAAG